jgi:hypothetical protein
MVAESSAISPTYLGGMFRQLEGLDGCLFGFQQSSSGLLLANILRRLGEE